MAPLVREIINMTFVDYIVYVDHGLYRFFLKICFSIRNASNCANL